MKIYETKDGRSYLLPFILVTSLFFLWGIANNILDVLNKHFQDTFELTRAKSGLVQAAIYGGYFLMAIPAGKIISRWGYRAGVLTGLILFGIGALLFIPGENINSFYYFVACLFIIGCGLTCLETTANPYITVLGDPSRAAQRINLAQSFNGLACIVAPAFGGMLVLANDNLTLPYTIIGITVLLVALLFSRVKLPEIGDEPAGEAAGEEQPRGLWQTPAFVLGVVSLFLYVAAQTGFNSFFINYMNENLGFAPDKAASLLGFGGMSLFFLGRVTGTWIMSYVKPWILLTVYALTATLATLVIVFGTGKPALTAFFVVYFCESIMFPTIFAMALHRVKGYTKQASSYLIMSIVGGAVAPMLMGWIGDHAGMALGFIIPAVCFAVICFYGLFYGKGQKSVAR